MVTGSALQSFEEGSESRVFLIQADGDEERDGVIAECRGLLESGQREMRGAENRCGAVANKIEVIFQERILPEGFRTRAEHLCQRTQKPINGRIDVLAEVLFNGQWRD